MPKQKREKKESWVLENGSILAESGYFTVLSPAVSPGRGR